MTVEDPALLKAYLKANIPRANPVFDYGACKESLIHAQMRMGCSALGHDLYRLHVVENSRCVCGNPCENIQHYFLHCEAFTANRDILMQQLDDDNVICNVDVLLYGNPEYSYAKNLSLIHI